VVADCVYCIFCDFAGSGDLGVHWRSISQSGARKGTESGKFFALDYALIAYIFLQVAKYSWGAPFLLFGTMMVLQFFVVLFFYPETKGVSLEQLQHKLGIE
jgi:hypothetical protein